MTLKRGDVDKPGFYRGYVPARLTAFISVNAMKAVAHNNP